MIENGRARFAMYWAASCGGCDIAVLNIHERLIDFAERFEVVFWPAVMDAKVADVAALPDGSIDVCLWSGGIRNDENEEIAHLLRAKSKLLVAFGSCASEGCIPGLANLSTTERILDEAFEGISTDNPDHVRPEPRWHAPEGELRLPALLPRLTTLDQVVRVDAYVPGCPPESVRISEVIDAVSAVLAGEAPMPPPGAVLGAGTSTVCDECARQREVKRITRFTRLFELPVIDPDLCLLEQGVPCSGPATRDGCGALCPAVGAPCIGCYGPSEGAHDAGARLLSAFASVVDASDVESIDRVLDSLADPVGRFYRFSLARSLLHGARGVGDGDGGHHGASASPTLAGQPREVPPEPVETPPEPVLAGAAGEPR